MRQLIKVFKSLSDETRLRILKVLQKRKELCVCKITQALKISQSRASRNLGFLRDAGLVSDRREGLWVHYSINHKKINRYSSALNELLKNWLNGEEIVKEDKKRLAKAVKLSQKNTGKYR